VRDVAVAAIRAEATGGLDGGDPDTIRTRINLGLDPDNYTTGPRTWTHVRAAILDVGPGVRIHSGLGHRTRRG
jgi:hypothetical protein